MVLIISQRLSLRPFQQSDLLPLAGILSDEISMAFWPRPFTVLEVQHRIDRNIYVNQTQGIGRLAIIHNESGELIGDCGLSFSTINDKEELDIGYIVSPAYWNIGVATEAANACLNGMNEYIGECRIVANMPIEHHASQRVAIKLGMTLECTFINKRNRNQLTYLYRMPDRTRRSLE